MSAPKSERLSTTIAWLWLGAATYTVGVLYLIFNTRVPNCAGGGELALGQEFLAAIRCLEPNQLGDALAGLFAPLAFLGLVIGIVYQRRDLAIQREDMELTRNEIKASTKALEAQAEQAAKTAVFIGKQTEAIDAERVRASLDEIREGLHGFICGPLNNRGWFGYRPQYFVDRDARANFETFVMQVRQASALDNDLSDMHTEELVWIMELFESYSQLAMDNPDFHMPSPDAGAVQSAYFLLEEIAANRPDFIPGNAFVETELVPTPVTPDTGTPT